MKCAYVVSSILLFCLSIFSLKLKSSEPVERMATKCLFVSNGKTYFVDPMEVKLKEWSYKIRNR
jgi:hypothetical protein